MTPSQARNAIKRCFKAIVDPKPTRADVDELWSYFGSRCAYCGQLLERASRQAHKDHLVAESEGGSNGLGNLVLSCGVCNGDEKRESGWESFLAIKCEDAETLAARSTNIRNWIATHDGDARLTAEQQQQVEEAFVRVNSVLTECVGELRHRLSSNDTTDQCRP